jgi:putative SOS response-associated peptidase YedK
MCSNYCPATGRELAHFAVAPPEALAARAGTDAFPGGSAPLIYRPDDRQVRACVAGTFGLLPGWAKERGFARHTYNARSETVAEKASFRNAWRRGQLCIVPALAIYEPSYESGKALWWRIARADGQPMALAGLWERKHWGDDAPSWSFTMLTVNADNHPLMRRFHRPTDEKRTVVILEENQIDAWLMARDEDTRRALLRPCDDARLVAAPGRLPAAQE